MTKRRPHSARYNALARARDAAEVRYRSFPNVVGVGAGTKYKDGSSTNQHLSIQFYVRKKVSPTKVEGGRLPSFVYGRHLDGSVDRSTRFATDVIEVGRIKGACGSGSPIAGTIGLTRQNGQATLIFQNKSASAKAYLVSCAHVIGRIDGGRSDDVVVSSDCLPVPALFASTLFSAAHHNGEVQYDVAIAEVRAELSPFPDLVIDGASTRFRSFMPAQAMNVPLAVSCVLPRSGAKNGVVSSIPSTVSVKYKKGTYDVKNAWLLKAERQVKEGDSGGIVHKGDVAIGIVFASSGSKDGWAWFHLLEDAIEYLQTESRLQIRCFP